jgi:hypothetical protein
MFITRNNPVLHIKYYINFCYRKMNSLVRQYSAIFFVRRKILRHIQSRGWYALKAVSHLVRRVQGGSTARSEVCVEVMTFVLRGTKMLKMSRSIYSCNHITNNLLANNISCLSREVYTSPNLNDKSSHYDIVIAGGGMVGTTLACTLGENSFTCSVPYNAGFFMCLLGTEGGSP